MYELVKFCALVLLWQNNILGCTPFLKKIIVQSSSEKIILQYDGINYETSVQVASVKIVS